MTEKTLLTGMDCLFLESSDIVRGCKRLFHIARLKQKGRFERIQGLKTLVVKQQAMIAHNVKVFLLATSSFLKRHQTMCQLLGVMLHLLPLMVCAIVPVPKYCKAIICICLCWARKGMNKID